MRNTWDYRKGGFTLIELLVVIAIISLLVSILMPTLTAAKEMARLRVCDANTRALSAGAIMYAGELTPDMRLPYIDNQVATMPGDMDFYYNGHHWGDLLVWNQFATQDHFKCPSEKAAPQKAGRIPVHYGLSLYLYDPNCKGANKWGGSTGGNSNDKQRGSRPTPGKYGPSVEKDIKHPSRTIMLSDATSSLACVGLWAWRAGGRLRLL